MKKIYKYLIATSVLMIAILSACVYLDSIEVDQPQDDGSMAPIIDAGKTATFVINGHIENAEDGHNDGERLIIAMLAPKSWDIRKNAVVTYQCDVLTDWDNVWTMSPIPLEMLPKNSPGTWSEALYNRFGIGPNVLNDMEWVAFHTDNLWDIVNGQKPKYRVEIKLPIAEDAQNLRARLGFFVNIDDDGLSQDGARFKTVYSDPFVVQNGAGVEIDYVNYHLFSVDPMTAKQDDFITFSFVGDTYVNDLVDNNCDVYFSAIATTETGNKYEVDEKTEKTLMKKEEFSNTHKKTIWPAGFFNIPEGETIVKIEYRFTDESGAYIVDKSVDDYNCGLASVDGEYFTLSMAKE